MPNFGTLIAQQNYGMERKFFVIALFLFGATSNADYQSAIDHFAKTFTFQNVEIIKVQTNMPLVASAQLNINQKIIILEGDLNKQEPDVLSLIMCHELGHAMGEYPRRPAPFDYDGPVGADGNMVYASEGAADYYATNKCLKYLWKDHLILPEKIDPAVEAKCNTKFKNQNDAIVCKRSSMAALNYLNVKPWTQVSFQTPDPGVVSKTITNEYPSRQCRLDTYLAGALNENRPLCWYKEVENPIDSICYSYNYQINPPRDPASVPSCRVIGETMYVDGKIDPHLYYELRDHYPNVKKLELNSYGGEIEDVYKTADLIRKRGITTNVRKGAKCGSACTLVYMAGVNRTAHQEVKFLFHGLNNGQAAFDKFYENQCHENGKVACDQELREISADFYQGTLELFRKYIELGASPQILAIYQNFEEDPDWFKYANFFKKRDWIMTVDEAKKLGIVHELSIY